MHENVKDRLNYECKILISNMKKTHSITGDQDLILWLQINELGVRSCTVVFE